MRTPYLRLVLGLIAVAALFVLSPVPLQAGNPKSDSSRDDNPYHTALTHVDEMLKMPLPMSPIAREKLDEELNRLGAQIAMSPDPAVAETAIQRANDLYKTFTEVPKPAKLPATQMETPPNPPLHGNPLQSVGPTGEGSEPLDTNREPPPGNTPSPEELLGPDLSMESHEASQSHEPMHPESGGETPHESAGNDQGGQSQGGHGDHCM